MKDPHTAQAYETARKDIAVQFMALKIALIEHGKGPCTWGAVGDLRHVNELLAEINEFMSPSRKAA